MVNASSEPSVSSAQPEVYLTIESKLARKREKEQKLATIKKEISNNPVLNSVSPFANEHYEEEPASKRIKLESADITDSDSWGLNGTLQMSSENSTNLLIDTIVVPNSSYRATAVNYKDEIAKLSKKLDSIQASVNVMHNKMQDYTTNQLQLIQTNNAMDVKLECIENMLNNVYDKLSDKFNSPLIKLPISSLEELANVNDQCKNINMIPFLVKATLGLSSTIGTIFTRELLAQLNWNGEYGKIKFSNYKQLHYALYSSFSRTSFTNYKGYKTMIQNDIFESLLF